MLFRSQIIFLRFKQEIVEESMITGQDAAHMISSAIKVSKNRKGKPT